MKFKLMGKFMITVVSVVIIVMIINIIAAFSFIIYNNETKGTLIEKKLKGVGAEDYTRNFSKCIVGNKEAVYIDNNGKLSLDNNNIWIQILDEQSSEVYSYKKPKGTKKSYTPFELINEYKYVDEKTLTTIFLGEKQIEGRKYSYIIGFPWDTVERRVITINNSNFVETIGNFIYIILILDALIALFFAYLFSRRLTKPVINIINGVLVLSDGKYDLNLSEKGLYTGVYRNLNNLSSTLRSNEIERKKLDQMREEWISNMSHDIKTPLVSIKGYAEILSSDDYDLSKEEINQYSKIIESKSNYIKELVDDLNLTTRLKNKVLKLNKKKVNMVSLARNAVIDLLNDPKNANVDIDFICDNEVIEAFVDDILIMRTIKNLVYNAIVHNKEGVKIKVLVEKNDNIKIVISDNGKGIRPEELNLIFERYYRGANTGKGHEGSGLGMAIARDIVKAHDGEIRVLSELGRGTEIEINL
ncbi:HAMP domain-containing histidine kinase [Clostridium sp. CF011]|uniref:sensor histidine kinase n=1 Tax=Clostridium sp. CF011 TaxID=2843318 RepID=UPI001C0E01BB|nr:HAMP domain-containing sensor histidine kinase [Clostridium sp. CF011]MBU3091224.1 HAMP domain-containing histidine kinase [Clostridium sp. CF011]WAG68534.1 HAMP domain-containing histidine kinase [Clostridium sp. CF011]